MHLCVSEWEVIAEGCWLHLEPCHVLFCFAQQTSHVCETCLTGSPYRSLGDQSSSGWNYCLKLQDVCAAARHHHLNMQSLLLCKTNIIY